MKRKDNPYFRRKVLREAVDRLEELAFILRAEYSSNDPELTTIIIPEVRRLARR